MSRRLAYSVAALVACASPCTAQEVEGFRLGMTLEQSRTLASSKGYTFSNPFTSPADWVTYLLMKEGPSISFCRNVVSAMSKQYGSNAHEFAGLLASWIAAFGQPSVKSSQFYVKGDQHSQVGFTWEPADNIRRSLSFSQFASGQTQISYGFSLISHPCKTS